MKRVFTYAVAMSLCIGAATAQNGSPYWSTSGNNNAAGTSKLGTTNSISLHFFTSNVQRMYIDSANGRVGIGVMSPQDRLHVNSASGENAFRAQISGVTKLLVAANGGTALGSNVTPPSSGLYVFGNTGLGNTSPIYKLQVKGDIAIDSGVYRLGGDPVLRYNVPNQSIALGNSGGTGTRLNTAVGYQALNNNTVGQANVAIGHKALLSDNSGYSNVAVGSHALYSNTSGYQLIAIGDSALYSNTAATSYPNIAIGSKALFSSTTGSANTATGFQSLYTNTTGDDNTGIGFWALISNTTGNSNVAAGLSALYENTTGNYNTGIGVGAINFNTTGSGNTAIGYAANVSSGNLTNASALGYFAYATASNQIMLGNSSITAIEAYAPYTDISDGRVKKNVKENVPGLAFINTLRPVTYNYDIHTANQLTGVTAMLNQRSKEVSATDKNTEDKIDENGMNAKEKILYTGFVAQEVEAAAKKLNYDFSGVHHPENDKDLYGLSYSEFVVPLVKAVQELSKQNDSLKNELASMHNDIAQLKSVVLNGTHTGTPVDATSQTVILSSAALLQNVPNPFGNSTTISYTLPVSYSKASVVITDKSGKTLKTVSLNGSNWGSMQVETSTLAAGSYQYSLMVDGKLMDTKQMLLAR